MPFQPKFSYNQARQHLVNFPCFSLNPSHSKLSSPLNKGLWYWLMTWDIPFQSLLHPTFLQGSPRLPSPSAEQRHFSVCKRQLRDEFVGDQRVLNSVVIRAIRQTKYRVGKIWQDFDIWSSCLDTLSWHRKLMRHSHRHMVWAQKLIHFKAGGINRK